MIIYRSNANWWGDLSHFAKSWTMVRVARSVAGIGLYSLALALLVDYFDWAGRIALNTTIFSLLGVILSIFLVFRTNTAYDRWWEGRKQWGALVNHCRNLALYLHTMLPPADAASRHFFATHISNFCLALVEHLRSGTKLEQLLDLGPAQRAEYMSKKHIPNHIALQIFQRIRQHYQHGDLDMGDYLNVKPQHQALLDILGACERIKKTPIPFSYDVYLKVFISAYGLLLPIVLVADFGYLSVPLSMFVFFALLGVELLGEEIEDPFGLDCNDLPTGDIARTISKNVFEIFQDGFVDIEPELHEAYEKVF